MLLYTSYSRRPFLFFEKVWNIFKGGYLCKEGTNSLAQPRHFCIISICNSMANKRTINHNICTIPVCPLLSSSCELAPRFSNSETLLFKPNKHAYISAVL